MRKFIVPQFIDIESKIIGPITARQFIIIIVTGVLDFVSYRLFTFNGFIFVGIVITVAGVVLAFLKINGSPFHVYLLNIISSLTKPPLRVWSKEHREEIAKVEKEQNPEADMFVPRQAIASGKLSELALIVDTGGMYKGEEEANFINNTAYGGKK